MQCDDVMKGVFNPSNLLAFYKSLPEEKYPLLKKQVWRLVSMFASTYISKQTFSRMKIQKSILRSCMSDEHLQDVLILAQLNKKRT
jgi:hypothetical protein